MRYNGDDRMRIFTRQRNEDRSALIPSGKRRRGIPSTSYEKHQKSESEIIKENKGRGVKSWLCGSISWLQKDISSVKHSLKHTKTFKVCGGSAYLVCGTCGVVLYFLPYKGYHKCKQCFFDYHDNNLFGIARDDTNIFGVKKYNWVYLSSF